MWKTKLGTCIYTSPSGFKVYQNLVYRWLTLGSNALQTVINRHYPYLPELSYLMPLTLLARNIPASNCCLLGLGGAGAVHLLAKHVPSSQITAVDCSKEVIFIAKKYFMIDQINSLCLVNKHAEEYLQNTSAQYKHLIIDLYDANHFPSSCNSEEFFSICKKKLSHDGYLAINLANLKEQWPIFHLIKMHFQHNTLVIPAKKSANIVILASKSDSKFFLIDKIKQIDEIKQITWNKAWGYVGSM